MFGLAPFGSLPFGGFPSGDFVVVATPDPLATVTINNTTARSLGLKVGQVTSWLDAPTQDVPAMALPGLAGSVHSDERPRVTPLDLKIIGTVIGTDRVDARAKLDRLITLVRASPLTIVFPDSPTRYIVADLASVRTEGVGASFRQWKFPVEIGLHACDPYRYDLIDTAPSGVAGVAIRCPLGTAPVRPVLTIAGPAVNPVLTILASTGAAIGTMSLTVTLLAADLLVVDCAAVTVKKNGAAFNTLITAGDFFQLDPAIHANRDLAAWPTVSCSSGFCTVRYRRAWS